MLAEALKHSVGEASPEAVHQAYERSDLIRGERDGQQMTTTRDVLKEERRLIEFARQGRGTCKPFGKQHESFTRDWLNDAQKKAVKHIVESRDRIILLRGAAGVGKTTLLQEAVETIAQSGTKVFAFAPSADASRGTLREAGFKDADTVATLLKNEKLQGQVAGQLLLIDESGLMGSKTMADVFDLAEKLNCRVLLAGDRYQHGSVERGAALKLLEEEAGLVPAEVKEIQRQAGAYKSAVKALSEGRVGEGFKRLDDLGWIREIPQEERYQQLAADYVQAIAAGKTALVVSPTHAEGDRVTTEIRRCLCEAGELGRNERTFKTLQNANLTEAERGDAVNFASGDVLVFHQNAKGFTRGERVAVEENQNLPLDQAARFQLFHRSTLQLAAGDVVRVTQNGLSADGKHRLNNGALYRIKGFADDGNILLDNGWAIHRDFGHLAYGYVVTSHSSQGKTVDRVFVGQSAESLGASTREQFYVSVSRAKQSVTIYTDNKHDLLDAVNRSDARLSATELVNGKPERDVVPLRQRQEERSMELQSVQAREDRTYDR